MTIWNTDKFTAIGTLSYTESREIRPEAAEVVPTGFRLDTLHCGQCGRTFTDFDVMIARGDAHVTCPAGHEGVINMFAVQVKDAA
ncbi:hypothetical protein N5K37_23500 [Delftia tsuruhatensis]|uniref:hypothetical protein n=1 Tax=Delftia tsuruhatensis TaxID=180282 RepID=UPI000B168FE3|nr:hypothetical protein [Delftia tsuruhatensis]MDH2232877.1 hypothetical protein [Delftia tsuruhatensis]